MTTSRLARRMAHSAEAPALSKEEETRRTEHKKAVQKYRSLLKEVKTSLKRGDIDAAHSQSHDLVKSAWHSAESSTGGVLRVPYPLFKSAPKYHSRGKRVDSTYERPTGLINIHRVRNANKIEERIDTIKSNMR